MPQTGCCVAVGLEYGWTCKEELSRANCSWGVLSVHDMCYSVSSSQQESAEVILPWSYARRKTVNDYPDST